MKVHTDGKFHSHALHGIKLFEFNSGDYDVRDLLIWQDFIFQIILIFEFFSFARILQGLYGST